MVSETLLTADLTAWLDYIQQLHHKRIDYCLERVLSVALKLQLTQWKQPVVTITGTNGKGSCAETLAAVWRLAGYRVAKYTSPHLFRFNERLQLGSEVCDDAGWIQGFLAVEAAREQTLLSFFEFTTLAALWCTRVWQPDVLVLEVGMGGRLDAVNVVEPQVAVITQIALDHCEYLGADREQIGREKIGIARQGIPLICGEPEPPDSLRAGVDALGAQGFWVGREFGFNLHASGHWDWWDLNYHYENLPVTQLYQPNVATALAALHQVSLPVTEAQIRSGLETVALPGRYQRVLGPVTKVFDVAHNPAGLALLAKRLSQETIVGRCFAVFGMKQDKALKESLMPLLSQIVQWFVAPLSGDMLGWSSSDLKETLNQLGAKASTYTSIKAAETAAMAAACPGDWIVICGSFSVVAESMAGIKLI